MTTCAWVGRGARGWVGVEVGAPVTQAFLGAQRLQAGLSRGGTPPAVLAWWREEKEVGDLFLDQNQSILPWQIRKLPPTTFGGALRGRAAGVHDTPNGASAPPAAAICAISRARATAHPAPRRADRYFFARRSGRHTRTGARH